MDNFHWSILESKYIVKDKWISLRADTCSMPDGRIVSPYYVLEYPGWVNVVALTKQKEVVLVRQYRHGLGRTLLELPCGCMEIGDISAEEAARRELLEETGYTGKEFINTGIISVNPANHNNLTHYFLVLDAVLTDKPHPDDTEQIQVVLKPLYEVIECLKKNEFLQALHVSAIFQALMYMNIIKF